MATIAAVSRANLISASSLSEACKICSASLRSLISREIAKCTNVPSDWFCSGTARVSIHLRVPRQPTISNSSVSLFPLQTLSFKAWKASLYSGAINEYTDWLIAASALSTSIIARPAAFISSKVPSAATSFTHSGSASTIARKRFSLSRNTASECLRSLISLTVPRLLTTWLFSS